jgi:hypothetical protein
LQKQASNILPVALKTKPKKEKINVDIAFVEKKKKNTNCVRRKKETKYKSTKVQNLPELASCLGYIPIHNPFL